jgi:hypothetical protein
VEIWNQPLPLKYKRVGFSEVSFCATALRA